MDTHANLVNIAAMRLYKYRYIDDYADVVGLSDEELIDLGVLAQEVSGQRDKERKREREK